MAYLSLADYTISIAIEHLNEILEQAAFDSGQTATQVRERHEALSQSTIRAYLKSKYEIDAELAKSAPISGADQRDPIILNLSVDLALCSLHKTINPRDVPELREKACVTAMSTLKEVRDGLVTLPIVSQKDNPPYYVSQIGSQVKFISKPFQDLSIFDED